MRDHYDVLIIGGGHGGAHVAIGLRQAGFAGSVAILSDDPDPPYERPPLSKDYLAGEKEFERILIRPETFWAERDIDLLLARRAVAVDPVAHRLATADGAGVGYGALVWATGGTPRRLDCPGELLAGVHTVRSRADVDAIRAELPGVARVVIGGGGYIGLEAAAVLTRLGRKVCLVEALDRVLARVAGPPLSRFFEAEHRAQGVDIRLGASVERIEESEGRASGVRLAGGETIAADLVIVGIGIAPAIEPLVAAGASAGNGVEVDGQCRTSLADIYAIGDCALHANGFAAGALVRLESVQNAHDQAAIVVKAIMGGDETYQAMPWFWSNQYDLKLQTVGLSAGHDRAIVRGDPATRSFSVVYLKQGCVIALDCVNMTRDYVQGRKLIVEGVQADPGRIADPGQSLKELAA